MKVTVERAALLRSLSHVHRVVERRNTIPILANVLIKAEKSKLAFKATDLDVEVTETIAAEVGPGGATTVPAHMFYEIVRKLPEGTQIVIEASGDRAVLTIRAGRSRFTLQTLPESDFPDLAAGDMTHKFSLAAADLKRLFDKTHFAI
ncbi:MAG TPA: DNA polymerase III subunit beta, partial [Xanthobacteraceae bacterium]|nr:DNA polymerase III subunit beta [Xanthobacteraceae bacterium]